MSGAEPKQVINQGLKSMFRGISSLSSAAYISLEISVAIAVFYSRNLGGLKKGALIWMSHSLCKIYFLFIFHMEHWFLALYFRFLATCQVIYILFNI